MPFPQTVEQWHDFYLLVGTAAATLIGLLFVALSINADLLRDKNFSDARALAKQTFSNFLYLIAISILFLIPGQSPTGLGVPLLALSISGVIYGNGQFRLAVSHPSDFLSKRILRRLVLPSLAFVALAIVSISIIRGGSDGFYWLVAVMIMMIFNASRNAWDLLLELPEARSQKPEDTK